MRFFTIKGCTSSKTRMRFVSQYKSASLNRLKNNNNNSKKYVIMSSIKEQVLAQQQGQYNESDDKYLAALK